MADVVGLLADLVPHIRHGLRWYILAQVDLDLCFARLHIGGRIVDLRDLLQLALDLVGDLVGHLLRGASRPVRLHNHGLDRELGVFLLAQAAVCQRAGH
ncbi:hypothetical protein D3C72_1976780 [compost metagenome]